MANDDRLVRDTATLEPAGLDEHEQRATLLKAAKERQGWKELTVVPAGTPPLGHGWVQGPTISAPGSGNVYRIYRRSPAHTGRGPVGTQTNSPVSDTGTMPIVQNTPKVQTGVTVEKKPDLHEQIGPKPGEQVASESVLAAASDLKNILARPEATEDQIAAKVQAAIKAAHDSEVADNDAGVGDLMEQAGDAVVRIEDLRNAAFEADLNQEARLPGSVPESRLTQDIQKSISGEKQKQLLGLGNDKEEPKAMVLMAKAVGIITERKAKVMKDLLDQEKRLPGSVSDQRFSTAVSELLGAQKQCQLLGIPSASSDNAFASVTEVVKIFVQRKVDARRRLLQQKQVPGSGVTDQQIADATKDLLSVIKQAQLLGVQVPDSDYPN
jgi:hypothetical protein